MLFSETPSADALRNLLQRAEQECLGDAVISRLRVILHFAEHRHSISETCRYFGISRSTFHRWVERFDPNNLGSLADRSHDPVTVRQSSVPADVTELIRRYRMRYPQIGKEKISELLRSDHAVDLSASTVARVIERECLYFGDTPFHWKKRLENQKQTHMPVYSDQNPAQPEVPVAIPFTDTVTITAAPAAITASAPAVPVPIRGLRVGQIGKFLVVSSVVTNLLFLGVLGLLSFFEHSVSASVLPDPVSHQHSVSSASVTSDRLR